MTDYTSNISFLIGAGFSVPAGYPTGNNISDRIHQGDEIPCVFHTDGTFVTNLDGTKPNIFPKSIWQHSWEFGLRLMRYYTSKETDTFDYEKFYDYVWSLYQQSRNKSFGVCDEILGIMPPCFINESNSSLQLYLELYRLLTLLPKVVSYLLREPTQINLKPYDAIFKQITNALKDDYIINIHSLNHDELIEKLVSNHKLEIYFTDGFESNGSNYYHEPNNSPKERLEVFTNHYNSSLRLYKLHGGIRYTPFFEEMEPNKYAFADYVKSIYDLDDGKIYSMKNGIQRKGTILPDPDFLIGDQYKIRRYDGAYYNTQIQNFAKNLKNSQQLIVIGYSFRDFGINEIMRKELPHKTKCVVIDKSWNQDKGSVLQSITDKTKVIESSVDSTDIDWRLLMLK